MSNMSEHVTVRIPKAQKTCLHFNKGSIPEDPKLHVKTQVDLNVYCVALETCTAEIHQQ